MRPPRAPGQGAEAWGQAMPRAAVVDAPSLPPPRQLGEGAQRGSGPGAGRVGGGARRGRGGGAERLCSRRARERSLERVPPGPCRRALAPAMLLLLGLCLGLCLGLPLCAGSLGEAWPRDDTSEQVSRGGRT